MANSTIIFIVGTTVYFTFGFLFSVSCIILPMTKPRKNKAATTTIHQIHRINLLSFLMLKQYVPEASTHGHAADSAEHACRDREQFV